MSYNEIPKNIVSLVRDSSNEEDSNLILDEIEKTLKLEFKSPPLVDNGKTYGDWNIQLLGQLSGKMHDLRPGTSLSLDIIEQMLKSAPVRFALEMKRAQIVSVFRNRRSWKVESSDQELAEVVKANLEQILPKMALDFSFSSLAYGVSFQELVWERRSKHELGITKTKYQNNRKFIIAKIPNAVNPKSVDRIIRTSDGHFNGFVQKPKQMSLEEVIVPRDASLIIPYEEKFRNLWGESLLKPMYPIWYWYEVVLRSMVRYMERTGTPVAVVKAPSRATVIKPGTQERVDGITWGMEIASNVARSNAAVIPSDTDESGKPLWSLDYLNSTEKSQPFLDILELLTQMILRAGLSADRALSQSSGGVGSYSIGEIHKEATALHNELILTQWVHYLNTYFLPLYSLYNRGKNGPTIILETQGLDPTDRTNLNTLLGVSQQMESFKEAGYRIDWESLLTVNNIPLLSEEEAKSKKKEQEENALKKQEEMLNVQSKFSTPSPTKQADGSLKANLPNKPAEKKELEDERLDLTNPYRDKMGRFASGPGRKSAALGFAGGGIPGAAASALLTKGAKVDPEVSARVGGAIGGGLFGYAGSAVASNSYVAGNGLAMSVGKGFLLTTAGHVATVGALAGAGLLVGAALSSANVTGAITIQDKDDVEGKNEGVSSALNVDVGNAVFAKFPGQDNKKYVDGVKKIYENRNDQGAIKEVASSLGISEKEVQEQLSLVDKYYKPGVANLPANNKHWGSREQLLSAHVTAQNLDENLTPEFAVLLNPTGGIVGPGSIDVSGFVPVNKEALRIHASVHDASGYLYNFQGKGPGYTYIGNSRYSGFALNGQLSGIGFWDRALDELKNTKRSLSDGEDFINLFNPYHDEEGQFASSKGLSGAKKAALISSSRSFAENKARSNPGSVVKTTGKILGLTGIAGVVGLMAVGAVADSDVQISAGNSMSEEERQERIQGIKNEINELSQNWPKFGNGDDAFNQIKDNFKDLGLEIPPGVRIEQGTLPAGVAGQYDYDTNTMLVSPLTYKDLGEGDPMAAFFVTHELAHSVQEIGTDGGFSWGEVNDEEGNTVQFIEGQNDLAALVAMSSMYDEKLSNDSILSKSNEFKLLNKTLDSLESGSNVSPFVINNISTIGYPEEVGEYARLMTAYNSENLDTFKSIHSEGLNAETHYKVLNTLFQEEMSENGYYKTERSGGIFGVGSKEVVVKTMPSMSEVSRWMDNHGYVDRDKALDMMLELAVQ